MSTKDAIHSRPSSKVLIQGYIIQTALVVTIAVLFLLIVFAPFLYPKTVGIFLVIPYLSYTLFIRRDEIKDGAHWPLFSNHFWIFNVMRQFLQLTIAPIPKELADEEKKEGAQFVFGIFPHGSWADYRVLMDGMLPEVFPSTHGKIKTLAASVLFRMPFVREVSLWTGCVDAHRAVAERQLDKGMSLLIIPGGEAEQIRTIYGKEVIFLKQRKGFIKLAMCKGAAVVPSYVFGCSDYYRTSSFLFDVRVFLVKKLGVCLPLVAGYLGSPFCPLPVKTTIVFGKPMYFAIKEEGTPTIEEVDAAHAEFVESLNMLFNDNKVKFGYGDRELEIV